MLEVIFLGVGEAFDETLPNTSILIRYEGGDSPATFLLDCGFTAPPPFWKEESDVNRLDGIWISHFHADHCFGIPALLVRFWEEGRDKGLTLLGQKGIESFTRNCLDLAYPGFYERLTFPLRFIEVEPEKRMELFGLSFRTAETAHSQMNLALRIDVAGKSIYYSGDGKATPESMALARDCEFIIHEACPDWRTSHDVHQLEMGLHLKTCLALPNFTHLPSPHPPLRHRGRNPVSGVLQISPLTPYRTLGRIHVLLL